MELLPVEQSDLPELLALQKRAFQSEAMLLQTNRIPPLLQTLPELEEEFQKGFFYKAVEEGVLLGSVRGRVDGGTLYIGKLMTAPEQRGKGVGTRLMNHIEGQFPALRKELFTSSQSVANIRLYKKLGYRFFRQERQGDFLFYYFEKSPAS